MVGNIGVHSGIQFCGYMVIKTVGNMVITKTSTDIKQLNNLYWRNTGCGKTTPAPLMPSSAPWA